MNIEYTKYNEHYKIGKTITLKKIDDYETELKIIKEELDKLNIKVKDKILCYFETSYQEKDIDTFIGYTLEENTIPKNIGTLKIITNSKAEKQLVCKSKEKDINNIFKKMKDYAEKHNIQIRGFYNILFKKEIEVYVEAFDLNEKNKDYIYYLEHFKKTNELDSSLVGKYIIREILPSLKYMYNHNKKKTTINSKYKELELKKDGSTNYNNITWNKDHLFIKIKEREIPLPLHSYQHNNKKYLVILMNEDYEFYLSERPMEYLYEKI